MVSYTSKIGGKTGTITISVLDFGTENFIGVNDISPTSNTDSLNQSDIMIISGSTLTYNYSDDWTSSFNLTNFPTLLSKSSSLNKD